MGILEKIRKKKKEKKNPIEYRDYSHIGGAFSSAAKIHPEIVEQWKQLVRARGYKNMGEALVVLMAEDLERGGNPVPSRDDDILNESSAIIKMAQSSASVVQEIAQQQIASYQEAINDAQEHFKNLQKQIKDCRKLLDDLNKEIADKEYELERKKSSASLWEKQKKAEQQALLDKIYELQNEIALLEGKKAKLSVGRGR